MIMPVEGEGGLSALEPGGKKREIWHARHDRQYNWQLLIIDQSFDICGGGGVIWK